MLCQKCKKNNATVFYRENINGKVTEYTLCPSCAKELEKNGLIKLDNPLGSLFSDRIFDFAPLISGLFGGLNLAPASDDDKRCPVCGSSFADIARTGRIGCPECYTTFADELSATVNRLHSGNLQTAGAPVGRVPKRFGEKQSREAKIASLKTELQSAITTQEFERAAELRDQIKALEANADAPKENGKESV